jgi:hypothetical protein
MLGVMQLQVKKCLTLLATPEARRKVMENPPLVPSERGWSCLHLHLDS